MAALGKGKQPNQHLILGLDANGLVRCRGQLQNLEAEIGMKQPILLPRNSPATEAYIREVYETNFYVGVSHVLATVRERFWITKGRTKVQHIVKQCMKCKRWTSGSFALPPMPPLPYVQVAQVALFAHTGVDYFGPMWAKVFPQSAPLKVHATLFSCLVNRAIHFELVRNLSGYEFLLTLARFAALKGTAKFIVLDNATNFRFIQTLVAERISLKDFALQGNSIANKIS